MVSYNTFYQGCFYFCVATIIATVCINFAGELGVFGVTFSTGVPTSGQNASAIFTLMTGLTGGMEFMWGLAIAGGFIGSVMLTYISRTTTPIAIFLFSSVFWTSYLRATSVVAYGGYIPESILTIAFVGMFCMFAGAIIGMLSGSG